MKLKTAAAIAAMLMLAACDGPYFDHLNRIQVRAKEFADHWAYSPAENGLQIRVEPCERYGNILCVRVVNVGRDEMRLRLPYTLPEEELIEELVKRDSATLANEKFNTMVYLEAERDGEWKTVAPVHRAEYWKKTDDKQARADAAIKSGASALIALQIDSNNDLPGRMRLRWKSQESEMFWRGEMTAPVAADFISAKVLADAKGKLELPTVAEFGAAFYVPPGAPTDLDFQSAWIATEDFRRQLEMYRDEQVLALLGKLAERPEGRGMRLVWEVESWRRGLDGKAKLAAMRTSTTSPFDLYVYCNVLEAALDVENPPRWAREELATALADTRPLSAKMETWYQERAAKGEDISKLPPPRVSDITLHELTGVAGRRRIQEAAVVLLASLKNQTQRESIMWALGEIGDKRAEEPMLEIIRTLKPGNGPFENPYGTAAGALAKLKSKKAVDILMQSPGAESIPTALAEIGDQRAVYALEQIAAGQQCPENGPHARDEATIALVKLRAVDKVGEYLELVAGKGPTELKIAALGELAKVNDERVPVRLLQLARQERDARVVLEMPAVLGKISSQGSIATLVELFEIPYIAKFENGEPLTPAGLTRSIAFSLQQLTAQEIGGDPAAWRTWRMWGSGK